MKKKKDTYHPRKIQNINAIGVRGVFVVVQSLLVRSVNPPWAILSHMEKWATMEACAIEDTLELQMPNHPWSI